jgi:hypothetical protein
VPFTKIIQPIETRWNSITMCVQSILKIRSPLLALKEENSPELADKIPNKKQFESLEEVAKPMMYIKEFSDMLQSESKPMMHMVTFILMQLGSMSKSKKFETASKTTKSFVHAFQDNLNKRIRDFGRKVKVYNVGNFIHPSFKGVLLKKGGSEAYEETIKYIKSLYEVPEERAGQGSVDMFVSSQGTQAQTSQPADSWQGLNLDDLLGEEGPIAQRLKDKTPIEIELEKWTEMTGVVRDIDINILAYWKAKSKELPLLGKLAKNILGLQVTSCSSERLFSEAGLVVTTKRQLLATSQCEKLIFIHENHDRLAPLITKWKTDLREFTDEEDKDKDKDKEKQLEPTPGTSAAGADESSIVLRFRKSSSSSDPDDPAALDINLVEEEPVDTPHEEEGLFYHPGPQPDEEDDDVEEVEPEDDE